MKRGPKLKVDAEARVKILATLSAGASRKDAADYLGIGYSTLRDAIRKDLKFRQGVIKAEKSAKIRLIKKVGSAKPWQSAAWMLERRYGAEYGRKETVKQEITGKDGGSIDLKITAELNACGNEFEHYAAVRRMGEAVLPHNGNGKPLPVSGN